MGALGSGATRLRGLLHAEDTTALIGTFHALGVPQIKFEDNGETLVIEGSNGKIKATGESPVRL